MSLENQSLAELTTHYNGLPGAKPVKKFRDKPTALKRIYAMEPKAEKKSSGAIPRWIAFKSATEAEYRVRVQSSYVLKYGRPHDFNGKPMIASKAAVEAALNA